MRKRFPATTLIEILFYFVILGILLTVAITFAIQVLNLSGLSSNISDIQSDLDFISDKMIYSIQTAESIDGTGSVFDDDAGVLSLNMSDVMKSPTIFSLVDNNLYFQEGAEAPVKLNGAAVSFDHLRFHIISFPKAPDQIVIDALLETAAQDISNLQKTFLWHNTVSLRL